MVDGSYGFAVPKLCGRIVDGNDGFVVLHSCAGVSLMVAMALLCQSYAGVSDGS